VLALPGPPAAILAVEFDDVERWARGNGLEILLIVIGSVLVARAVHWFVQRSSDRLARREQRATAEHLPTEEFKQRRALLDVGGWVAVGLVYFAAVFLVLVRFNIPLATLVAPFTVLGVALGFGLQRVVQDLVSGVLLISERQYGLGDNISVAPVGTKEGVAGTVEAITLRTTTLRTIEGEAVVIPNGEIRQMTNRSKEWARVVVDVPIPLDQDVARATELLEVVANAMSEDARWRDLLLETPNVWGVESLDVGFLRIRLTTRTLPARQWDVARELRRRAVDTLRAEGMLLAPPSVIAGA
jgi:small conductance mechanosensitive channel